MFLTGQIELMAFKIQEVCLRRGSADILLVNGINSSMVFTVQ